MEQRRQSFIGFALYDTESGEMLVEHNSDKYFMPASSTKLFTFYASQKMIGDSIPALKYVLRGDSLLFWAPSEVVLTHKNITETKAFRFLKSRPEKLYYIHTPSTNTSNAIDWGWDAYMVQLFADTMKRPIKQLKRPAPKNAKILYGTSANSIFRHMLLENDNLLADQLLALSSGTLSDTLSVERAIRYMLRTHLADLPDKPVWVDGSGLSTLNMFTPRTITMLLQKLLKEYPQKELLSLLVTGETTEAVANLNKTGLSFDFSETGTLAHAKSQSGYVVTRSGKVLLYSFMNNNFSTSPKEIQSDMSRIMAEVQDNY
jgi:D-alanyl-D-alanine carboxypeptidase